MHFPSKLDRIHSIFSKLMGMQVFCAERFGHKSDGIIINAQSDCVLLNIEVRNENDISGDPFMKNVQNYVSFLADKNSSSCRPCLLIEISGPEIRVSGALIAESTHHCEYDDSFTTSVACICDPLTPTISFVRTGIRKEFLKICRLFSCLKKALEDLGSFYRSRFHKHVLNCCIPSPLHFAENGLTFVRSLTRRVYSASMNLQAVIVKFAESYCLELHELLAKNEMAPKILKTFQVKPYWTVLVMERLKYFAEADDSDVLLEYSAEVSESVSKILCLMRQNVHGDFRSSNVLCELDYLQKFTWRVLVIDFEWAGKQGEATYPVEMNPEVDWPEGCEAFAPLEFAHDEYWANSFNLNQ
jgi:hypothetical protein